MARAHRRAPCPGLWRHLCAAKHATRHDGPMSDHQLPPHRLAEVDQLEAMQAEHALANAVLEAQADAAMAAEAVASDASDAGPPDTAN